MSEEIRTRRSGQTVADFRLEEMERRMNRFEDKFDELSKSITTDLHKVKERLTIITYIIIGAAAALNIIGPEAGELLKSVVG